MRALAERLLDAVKCPISLDNVTIVETGEPVLKTKLRAAETAAAALAAQAALICEIWRQRTGRSQAASLDLQGAGLALQSVNHQRVWKYPIAYPEPTYPTVAIYPTKDGRHVMINGGYPTLRNGLLEMLDCANTAEAVRRAVGRRTAADIEDQAAAGGLGKARSRSRWWTGAPPFSEFGGDTLAGIVGAALCNPTAGLDGLLE
jgi:hypothetical protein